MRSLPRTFEKNDDRCILNYEKIKCKVMLIIDHEVEFIILTFF